MGCIYWVRLVFQSQPLASLARSGISKQVVEVVVVDFWLTEVGLLGWNTTFKEEALSVPEALLSAVASRYACAIWYERTRP